MKKIITLLMCLICCCSYAFLYEGNGGDWLSEDIAVGSGGGDFPVYEGDKCTITIANNINLTEIDIANIPIGYPTEGLFQYCLTNNLFDNFDIDEAAYNLPNGFAVGTPLLVEATATYNIIYIANLFTITYYSDEGVIFTTQQFTAGSVITEPADVPTYSNNDVFCWWEGLPRYMPARDISVYAEHQHPYIYGVSINESTQEVTYTDDAVGKSPIRVSVDSNRGAGTTTNWTNNEDTSWRDWVESICCPVMLLNNGEEDYELDRDNHYYKSDGVTLSDITNDSYNGSAMVRFRKTYTSVTRIDSSNVSVKISNYKADNTFTAYPWQTEGGRNANRFYVAMYLQPDSSTYRSYIKSGAYSLEYGKNYNSNTEFYRSNTKNIGQGWDWLSYSQFSYIRTLLIMVTKSIKFQTDFAISQIHQGGSAGYALIGYTADKGCFYGTTNRSYLGTGCKMFYIENFYGSVLMPLLGAVYSATDDYSEGYKAYPPYFIGNEDNYTTYIFINSKPATRSFGIVDNMLIPLNSLSASENGGFDGDIVYSMPRTKVSGSSNGYGNKLCLVGGGYSQSATTWTTVDYFGLWYKGGANNLGTARLAYLN